MTETRYTVTAWVTLPNDAEGNPSYTDTELEKHLSKVLRRADGDIDLEVTDTEIIGTEDDYPSTSEDIAYERAARGNDFAETGGKDWT